MHKTMADRLPGAPVQNLKTDLKRGEGRVRKLNPDAGDVLDIARESARLEPKQMADVMDLSHSLVLRGLKSADDLGFHRLWELPDRFWAELIVAIAQRRNVATVRTTIELGARRSA